MGKSKNIKPVLFLSHVHEDAEIASKLKYWLDKNLAKAINVFVSSDKKESMPAGSSWWDEIRNNLKKSRIVVALITRRSKDRSWIYFEVGGAYFQKITIVPILIGLRKEEIKSPLSQITYLDFSITEDFKDFCDKILDEYELAAELFDLNILKEINSLDKKMSDLQISKVYIEEKIEVTKVREISDEDALNILESWMGQRSDSDNKRVMVFEDVDKELNLQPGTAKKLIRKAAERWDYELVRQGEDTILFKEKRRPTIGRNPVTDW